MATIVLGAQWDWYAVFAFLAAADALMHLLRHPAPSAQYFVFFNTLELTD
jgi:hypothetical protein